MLLMSFDFLHQILIPRGDHHREILRAVGYALATQPAFGRDIPSGVEHIFFIVGGALATLQPGGHMHVAGRTGADAAAGVIDFDAGAVGQIHDAARFPTAAERDRVRIDGERFRFARFFDDERHGERLRRSPGGDLGDVRVLAGHRGNLSELLLSYGLPVVRKPDTPATDARR